MTTRPIAKWLAARAAKNSNIHRVLEKFYEELANLAQFIIFIAIGVAAHSVVRYLDGKEMEVLRYVAKTVEYAALGIGAAEYIAKLAKRAYRGVMNDDA